MKLNNDIELLGQDERVIDLMHRLMDREAAVLIDEQINLNPPPEIVCRKFFRHYFDRLMTFPDLEHIEVWIQRVALKGMTDIAMEAFVEFGTERRRN